MVTTISTYPKNSIRKTSVRRTVDTEDKTVMDAITTCDPYLQVVVGQYDTYIINWREVFEGARALRRN